jgi:hypothetical protein
LIAGVGTVYLPQDDIDFIYLLKGSRTNELYRYRVAADLWERLRDAPSEHNRSFGAGSCIAVNWNGNIYVMRGKSNEFFEYVVSRDSWAARPSLPLIGSSGKKRKAGDGAAMGTRNWSAYVLKGGNTRETWIYSGGDWQQDEDMPVMSGKNVKAGGALAASPDLFYALKGNNTREFYMYGPYRGDDGKPGPTASGVAVRFENTLSLSVSPNPAVDAFRISYTLPDSRAVNLKVYDVSGRQLALLSEGMQQKGRHDKRISASSLGLSRGVYLLKLVAGSRESAVRFVKSR